MTIAKEMLKYIFIILTKVSQTLCNLCLRQGLNSTTVAKVTGLQESQINTMVIIPLKLSLSEKQAPNFSVLS